MKKINEELTACLVDGAAGIYVPLRFACAYDMAAWNVREEQADILRAGPNHKHYWDAWEDVLREAFFIDEKGKRWTLGQDSDLFAYREDFDHEAA